MATVVKDFKIKSGLIVEGTTGKINNFDILTKKEADQTYITNLVGGTGTALNTPDTLVKRDGSGNFAAGTITANLTGDVTGTVSSLSNHDTDDLAEGTTNKYYSTTQAKTDAATLLTSATLTNITITGDGSGLTITAEDGIGGKTTDDLSEGETNLYFTDTRARNAVSAGEGLDYNSSTGVFSADLGYGLQIDGNGQIEINTNVIVTDDELQIVFDDHNASTNAHGVSSSIVGVSDAQELTNKTLGTGTVLSANLDAGGFTVSGLAEPVNASDAATKGYVDAVVEGLHIHESVVAATTANVDLSTGGLLTIDGVTLTAGDRVLVKSQSAPAENGIYVAASGAWTRATDYDSAAEVQAGDFVFVSGGTLYNSTGWVQENPVTTLGTDPIVWDQFSGAGEYTAGNGLTLNGTEFAINTTVTATKTYVDDEIDAHAALTATHGVAGDIVGTSDQQTLSNKVLGSNVDLGANLDAVNTYKVVNLADPTSNQDAATKAYVDGEISSLSGTVDNLQTSDVAEDPNGPLYFTDTRAKESAADLIVNAIKTNITITGDENGLTITAENGVADSTTSDLAEGTNLYYTNQRVDDYINASITTEDITEHSSALYFTDARAVSALQAVTPNFEEVELNSVAKQVAATLSAPTAGIQPAFGWAVADYKSAEFLVKVAYGSHTEISKVLLTLDTSNNIAITEYGIVGTNGSASSISASVSNGNVSLDVTTTNNNSTVTVVGTLLA